ncbi:GDSL esterase/lipase [Vigna angularis]|uniref:GDSL esterase/lipase n=1 Tax=Phaseolus angularis TaxID=3914 RepID=A0A8T0LDK0_PHAAN|nr:GDSL esterase/lipase [Vigna angularis]
MQASFSHSFLSKIFLLLILSCFVATIEASKKQVSAMYVFGDSTVDPGNNNFIDSAFRSNFPPYGRDFVNQVPTGRFTNGKLGTDFIASYLGLKDLLPPYLDPNLSDKEIVTGVSFASAGSGFDPLTPTLGNVISIPKQLEHFKEYKKRLEGMLGERKTEHHMNSAFFFISAGTNDYVINYFSVPIRRNYTPLTYGQFLLQHVKDFIQRGCVDKYSAVARHYNMMLQHELFLMQLNFSNVPLGAKISYIDIYEPLNNMIQSHENFGFDEVDHGCCGSGYIETTFMCNGFSFVCSDPSKFVFWDSIHPTEKAYFRLFMVARPNIDALINA